MAQIDDLPPLREVIAAFGLDAKKSLGQNFLLDLNLTAKIARAAGSFDNRVVIEVGPGPGGLTRALLASGAAHVIAIERDSRCLPALQQIADHYPARLTLIEGDALRIDYAALCGGKPAKIVANLPYNVGTALLTGWLTSPWPPFFESLTLMFQREVADRIVATSDDPANYGRLGVLCGWRAQSKILFDLPPGAFTPPPKVTSSVVELLPRPSPLACDLGKLEKVTAAAFGQRRKMLRQSLKALGNASALLQSAGIDETRRPETLTVAEFVALANAMG